MAWCSHHSEIWKAISGRSTSTIILWTWYSVGFVLRIHVFALFFNFDPQNRFTLRKTSGNPESSLWKGQPVSKVQTHDFPCFSLSFQWCLGVKVRMLISWHWNSWSTSDGRCCDGQTPGKKGRRLGKITINHWILADLWCGCAFVGINEIPIDPPLFVVVVGKCACVAIIPYDSGSPCSILGSQDLASPSVIKWFSCAPLATGINYECICVYIYIICHHKILLYNYNISNYFYIIM